MRAKQQQLAAQPEEPRLQSSSRQEETRNAVIFQPPTREAQTLDEFEMKVEQGFTLPPIVALPTRNKVESVAGSR